MRRPRRRTHREPSCHLSRDSQTTPLPPADAHTIALSIADCGGTTVAVHKRNSRGVQWKTIGENLIAYWAGDAGHIRCYLDAVAQRFSDTQRVSFHHLMKLKSKLVHLFCRDECNSGPLTIHFRDRLRTSTDIDNLLKMEFSKSTVTMTVTTETSSALGSGAQAAVHVLKNYSYITSCNVFGEDKKLREHIVSKVIVEVVPPQKRGCPGTLGCCELIRGSSTQGWKRLSTTGMDTLLSVYRTQPNPREGRFPLCSKVIVNQNQGRKSKHKKSGPGLLVARQHYFA